MIFTMPTASGIFCRSCGYDLRASTDHRCPECGRQFNPAQRKSYDLKPRRKTLSRWLWRAGITLALAILASGITFLWLWRGYTQDEKAYQRLSHFGIIRKELAPMPIIQHLLPERYQYLRTRVWSVCIGASTLTDEDWQSIRQMENLRDARLGNLPVGEKIVSHIEALHGLTFLQLSCRTISDDDIARIVAAMPKLQNLQLSWPEITEKGLIGIAKSKSLQVLTLLHGEITDQAMTSLAQMPSLQQLLLSAKVSVTDQAIARLKAARPDVKVKRLDY